MNALMEKIKEAANKRRSANDKKYWALVHTAASGAEVNPENVIAFLESTGRDVHAFQKHVEVVAERIRVAAGLERLPDLQKELIETEAKGRAELDRFEPIHVAHVKFMDDVRARMKQLENQIASIDSERLKIFREMPYPEIEAERKAVLSSRMEAIMRVDILQARVREDERFIALDPEKHDSETKVQIQNAKDVIEAHRAKLREAESKVKELNAAAEAIEQLWLTP